MDEKAKKTMGKKRKNMCTVKILILQAHYFGRGTRSQSQTHTVINSWVTSCVYFIGSNGKVHCSSFCTKKGAPCCSHSISFCHDSSKYFKVFFFLNAVSSSPSAKTLGCQPKIHLSFCLDLIPNHQWCGSESMQLLGNFLKACFLLAFLLFLLSSCLACRNDAFVSSMHD